MKVMFLSGAGGVGKSSVAHELAKIRGIQVKPSTTRDSYARLGLRTEHEARNLDPEKQVRLQEQIVQDYRQSLEQFITQCLNDDVKVAVVDRSPLDHAAYLYGLAPWLDLRYIRDRQQSDLAVFKTMQHLTGQRSRVMYFPFPVHWQQQEDGVREVQDAKNYVWACTLQNMLASVPQHLVINGSIPFGETSIRDRSDYCLQTLGITWTESSTAA